MRKKIKLAAGAFGAIMLLAVCCMVFLLFGLKDKPTELTINVLKGDIGMLNGFSVETGYTEYIETKGNVLVNSKTMAEHRAIQKVDFAKNKATVTWEYEKSRVPEQEIKEVRGDVEFGYPQDSAEGIVKIKGNEMKTKFSGYNGEESLFIEDYVTFAPEDEFLFFSYETDSAEYKYKMNDRTRYYSDLNRRTMVTFREGDYGYIDFEPDLSYTCTCNYKGVGQGTSDYLEWTTEEAIDRLPDETYVTLLKEFGPPEYHMTVKKGLYLFHEDGTTEYVYPTDGRMEGFTYKQIAGYEEEGVILLFGVQDNQAVVFVYTVATGEMNRVVLWEDFGELGGYALSLDGAQITFFMASKEWEYCTVVMRMNPAVEIMAVQESGAIQLWDTVYSSAYSEHGFLDDFICDVDVYVDGDRIYVGEMTGIYAKDVACYEISILENNEVVFSAEITLNTWDNESTSLSGRKYQLWEKVNPVHKKGYGQRTIKFIKEN